MIRATPAKSVSRHHCQTCAGSDGLCIRACLHTLPSGARHCCPPLRSPGFWLGMASGRLRPHSPWTRFTSPPAQVPWNATLSSIGPLPWLCSSEVPISPTRQSKRNFRLGAEVFFFFFFLQSIFLQFNLKIGAAGCTCIKRIHFITVYE